MEKRMCPSSVHHGVCRPQQSARNGKFAVLFLRIWLHGGVISGSTGFFPVPCTDGSTEGVLLSLAGRTFPPCATAWGNEHRWAAGI